MCCFALTFIHVLFFYVSDSVASYIGTMKHADVWFSLLLPPQSVSVLLAHTLTHFVYTARSLQILTSVANGVLTSNTSQSETLLNIDPFFSSGFPMFLLTLPLLNGLFNHFSFFFLFLFFLFFAFLDSCYAFFHPSLPSFSAFLCSYSRFYTGLAVTDVSHFAKHCSQQFWFGDYGDWGVIILQKKKEKGMGEVADNLEGGNKWRRDGVEEDRTTDTWGKWEADQCTIVKEREGKENTNDKEKESRKEEKGEEKRG